MGSPSEYRSYDLRITVGMLSMIPTAWVVMVVFMPFFHRLQVYTAYEYLEKRFNVTVRALASAVIRFLEDPLDGNSRLRALSGAAHHHRSSLDSHDPGGRRGGHALHGGGGNAGRDLDRRGPVFRALGGIGAGPLGGQHSGWGA